jgi:hypothetical protein
MEKSVDEGGGGTRIRREGPPPAFDGATSGAWDGCLAERGFIDPQSDGDGSGNGDQGEPLVCGYLSRKGVVRGPPEFAGDAGGVRQIGDERRGRGAANEARGGHRVIERGAEVSDTWETEDADKLVGRQRPASVSLSRGGK